MDISERRLRQACRAYCLAPELITPSPQQNGFIERFLRRLKEERIWQSRFGSFEEAKQGIHKWMRW
ncbi:MAG TPA: hypothetical protein DD706_14610 [Nitrospiraceae bacterium]|nr:hypothetical protein [Nitrospiraceae bacterium]